MRPHLTVRKFRRGYAAINMTPAAEVSHTQIAHAEAIRLKNIFVGNLSFNTSEEELRQMFEPFGQVDRVSIMTDRETGRSRGFGFVEMPNEAEANSAIGALNEQEIQGRKMMVNIARPKEDRPARRQRY